MRIYVRAYMRINLQIYICVEHIIGMPFRKVTDVALSSGKSDLDGRLRCARQSIRERENREELNADRQDGAFRNKRDDGSRQRQFCPRSDTRAS